MSPVLIIGLVVAVLGTTVRPYVAKDVFMAYLYAVLASVAGGIFVGPSPIIGIFLMVLGGVGTARAAIGWRHHRRDAATRQIIASTDALQISAPAKGECRSMTLTVGWRRLPVLVAEHVGVRVVGGVASCDPTPDGLYALSLVAASMSLHSDGTPDESSSASPEARDVLQAAREAGVRCGTSPISYGDAQAVVSAMVVSGDGSFRRTRREVSATITYARYEYGARALVALATFGADAELTMGSDGSGMLKVSAPEHSDLRTVNLAWRMAAWAASGFLGVEEPQERRRSGGGRMATLSSTMTSSASEGLITVPNPFVLDLDPGTLARAALAGDTRFVPEIETLRPLTDVAGGADTSWTDAFADSGIPVSSQEARDTGHVADADFRSLRLRSDLTRAVEAASQDLAHGESLWE